VAYGVFHDEGSCNSSGAFRGTARGHDRDPGARGDARVGTGPGLLMAPDGWLLLLGAATTVDGLLAGASADQSIEQLPARRRIGVRAYHAYTQASHMANGRFWLVPLGIAGPLLRLGAALWAWTLALPSDSSVPVYVAAALAIAHALSTVRAASINWALTPWQLSEKRISDEKRLAEILNRFERWQALRASLQFLTFVAGAWALSAQRI